MKTPLDTDVDLGPGHIVLDGVSASGKGTKQVPLFSAHVYCGHGRPSQLLLSFCLFYYPMGLVLQRTQVRMQSDFLPFLEKLSASAYALDQPITHERFCLLLRQAKQTRAQQLLRWATVWPQ